MKMAVLKSMWCKVIHVYICLNLCMCHDHPYIGIAKGQWGSHFKSSICGEIGDFPASILSMWIIIIKLSFEIPIAVYFWLNAIFKS